ncbi:MAG TPA: LolA-related protein, partial [Rhodanobacteraceae bacterium]
MTAIMLACASAISSIPSRAAPETPGTAGDAQTIVAGLKRDAPARTRFAEVRFSGLLDRPLILHGELEYDGPGKLARTVDSPYRERMTVEGDTASVQRGDNAARKFSLSQAPELEGFLRGFAALLGGDTEGLARDFHLGVSGST